MMIYLTTVTYGVRKCALPTNSVERDKLDVLKAAWKPELDVGKTWQVLEPEKVSS